MTQARIPETDSIRELAEFWDAHDVTDFEEQLEEVTEPIFDREDGHVVRVRLDVRDEDALNRLAESAGIPPAELISRWVHQKVHERHRTDPSTRRRPEGRRG